MVDREQRRGRYLGGSEGAPPTPPPGGYRGARRVPAQNYPQTAPVARDAAAATAEESRPGPGALGWIALAASGLFLVILLSLLRASPASIFFDTPLIALQLIVVAVTIAALVTRRARTLGAIALSIALLANIGTVGAASAVQAAESGDFDRVKTDRQRHDEAFPGIRDVPSRDILNQPSLEEMRARANDFMADVRATLTARYGYSWVQVSEETLRAERNGYGGESMLVQMLSAGWATNEPVDAYIRKVGIMSAVGEVAARHDMWGPYSLNDDPNFDRSLTEKLYGSADPRTQHTWEWYSSAYPDPGWLYITIYDLSQDRSGQLRATREAQSARTGEPREGIQLIYYASELLSETDRAEFIERMRGYPGR